MKSTYQISIANELARNVFIRIAIYNSPVEIPNKQSVRYFLAGSHLILALVSGFVVFHLASSMMIDLLGLQTEIGKKT